MPDASLLDNPTYPVEVRRQPLLRRAEWLLKKPIPDDETQIITQVMFGRMIIGELVARVKTLEGMGGFRV